MYRKPRFVLLIAALVLVFSIFGAASVSADSGSATYRYLAAAGFLPEVGADLCDLGPPGVTVCPAVAMADNGDTIELAGEGTLSIHPKSATGGGTFTHKDAAGNILASGTWTAMRLLSFTSYGGAPTLPPTWEGGQAVIRIQLDPGAPGGPVFDAILTVDCNLAPFGGKAPASTVDGIRLVVKDGLNFNKSVERFTLFVRQ